MSQSGCRRARLRTASLTVGLCDTRPGKQLTEQAAQVRVEQNPNWQRAMLMRSIEKPQHPAEGAIDGFADRTEPLWV